MDKQNAAKKSCLKKYPGTRTVSRNRTAHFYPAADIRKYKINSKYNAFFGDGIAWLKSASKLQRKRYELWQLQKNNYVVEGVTKQCKRKREADTLGGDAKRRKIG